MKKSIIIGKSNVGKTLFMINFAEFLGLEKIYIIQEFPDGKKLNREMSIEAAREYLSSSSKYKTQCIQSIDISIPVYKGKKEIKIMDTSGLIDGIHPDISIRSGIIQTLERLHTCDIIIHIIDVSLLTQGILLSQIDRQIIEYGISRRGYILLANKIDLDKAKIGLNKLKKDYEEVYILPMSALYKTGLDEVKAFVIRSI